MNKLEDMMNYYNLKEEELLEEVPFSQEESQRVLQKTMLKAGIPGEPGVSALTEEEVNALTEEASTIMPKAQKTHRRRFALLTAACIVILALGAVSFAAVTLNSNFLAFFHPKSSEEANLLTGLGTIIDKKVTNNGLTIHVREALGDSNAVYVIFDLITPKDQPLDRAQYTFVDQWVNVDVRGSHGAGYHFDFLGDDNPTDNKKTMVLCYSSSAKLSGKDMTFRFQDLASYKTPEELKNRPQMTEPGTPGDDQDTYNILIPGEWAITFPLNYTDHTQVYKLNEPVSYQGLSLRVKEVRLSPISISMTLSTSTENTGNQIHSTPLLLHMKDGGTIDADKMGSRGTNTTAFKAVVDAQFNEIINPDDVQSIEYCGTVLPIKF